MGTQTVGCGCLDWENKQVLRWIFAGSQYFLAVGVWTVQHSVRPSGKEDETDCPVCGKMNDSANKFCMFCGSRMEAPR